MKTTLLSWISLSIALSIALGASTNTYGFPSGMELIKKAEHHTRGETLESRMRMTVIRGSAERRLEIKAWTVGKDKAVVKILSPEKDRDTGNLRVKFDIWQYLPNLERTIKIPPSMMLQSWMGSDFTNDDLVKTSSISRDYTHTVIGEEVVAGMKTYKIECIPRKDAPIAWGKMFIWVRNPDGVPVKHEYYSENGQLAKIMLGTELKTFGSHTLPTKLSMKLPRRAENETRIEYLALKFDHEIPESTFTQEFLKKRAKN